ncbi:MAG: helix-turn-helix domain-containing protein [Chloroflexota bacterium]|nr:helix-turn-helix domain-containing protein [Chloroflexota bacterium]
MDGFGERLRRARERVGLGQRDLAAAAGIGVATVARLEVGQTHPRPVTVRRLAAALGVRVPWLAVGEEPMLEETKGAGDAVAG